MITSSQLSFRTISPTYRPQFYHPPKATDSNPALHASLGIIHTPQEMLNFRVVVRQVLSNPSTQNTIGFSTLWNPALMTDWVKNLSSPFQLPPSIPYSISCWQRPEYMAPEVGMATVLTGKGFNHHYLCYPGASAGFDLLAHTLSAFLLVQCF